MYRSTDITPKRAPDMCSVNVVKNVSSRISKHVWSCDIKNEWICSGNCTIPIVRSLTNSVENNIWDDVNLFLLVLIIPNIESKLTMIINGMKTVPTTENSFSWLFASTDFIWSSEKHLGNLWRIVSVVLFMTRSKRNKQIHINLNKSAFYEKMVVNVFSKVFICFDFHLPHTDTVFSVMEKGLFN